MEAKDELELIYSKEYIEYEWAIHFMEERVNALIQKKQKGFIWMLEHSHCYTCGRSTADDSAAKERCLRSINNVPLFYSPRGGQYTYHGPGQRIIYFAVDLKKIYKNSPDIGRFIKMLGDSVVRTLREFNIEAYFCKKDIGVWVSNHHNNQLEGCKEYSVHNDSLQYYAHDEKYRNNDQYENGDKKYMAQKQNFQTNTNDQDNIDDDRCNDKIFQPKQRKIAALGLRVRRWVAYHGIAVNISNDLSYFNHIVPCGIKDKNKGITSCLEELQGVSYQQKSAKQGINQENFNTQNAKCIKPIQSTATKANSINNAINSNDFMQLFDRKIIKILAENMNVKLVF